ncbi:thioesterase family protein [Mucilaginibacter gossypii]|uniref:acyl-CoA thioesterase n=1 Tax=Mucilaginibacter gossypii TaxID=551996 RepID=UPI001AA18FED|nr:MULTISPECIES: thioesterase family protein [Mucilaginibacter]QTE35761.1 thioesterase family protein [Mucilaginibacter gossypii]
MQQSLINTIEIEVKFSDVDMLGVVWHGNYIRYFEDGREAFGKQYDLGYMDVYNAGYVVPIVNVNCDYKRFLRYEDKVIIETTYTPTESAKINFTYRLLNAQTGELIVKGSTTQVFVRRDNFELQLTNPDFFLDWKQQQGLI